MIPDLRQLRYFVASAEELRFARTPEPVGVAQPPVAQQIQQLEGMLGCRLFVRGRKTVLTEAGAAPLEESRRILRQMEDAGERTRRASRGECGQLRLGAPPSIMLSALPRVIRTYRRLYPEVQFTLRELSTSAIEAALRSEQIDLGLLRETQPTAPAASRRILGEPMVAVLPASHPLASRKGLTLAVLRREPFVFFPRGLGPEFYDRLVSFCTAAGFFKHNGPKRTWQSLDYSSISSVASIFNVRPAIVPQFQPAKTSTPWFCLLAGTGVPMVSRTAGPLQQ